MSLIVRRFRDWWQPPRKPATAWSTARSHFWNFFYDLVYVALIAQLSHALAGHISWSDLAGFAFLFIIVWWAWFNGTSYHDLHGNNDIRTRVFTFLQMLSVVAMAIFAHDALGETSTGFALSYAAFQLILTYLWWRTGVHDPDHRPLSRPYVASFLITTLLFVASVFSPAPWRFYLWGIALLFSLLMPVLTMSLGKNNPHVQAQIDIVTTVSPSMVERFGLFSIIILGEVVVGEVGGATAHHHLSWLVGLTAILGTLVAIGLWWVYFDFISHRLPSTGTLMVSEWFYLHLPLTMGIATVGAAVFYLVEHAGEHLAPEVRWLLVFAMAVTLVSVVLLTRTIQLDQVQQSTHRVGRRVMLVSAVIVLLLGFTSLETIPLLIAVVLLLLAPIFFALKVWIAVLDQSARMPTSGNT